MDTIQRREERSDILEYKFSSLDDEGASLLRFEIRGLTGERSYEDRDVILRVSSTTPIIERAGAVSIGNTVPEFQTWLRGEDAIELGLKLVEHGKFALESCIINHQAIHVFRNYQNYLSEGRVEEVRFEMINDNPPNYGDGFRLFKITPIWNEGMAPEYNENFTLEKVIYWSPFPEEYADQLDVYTRGTSYSFEGYDHDAEVRAFNESVRLMSGNDV